MTTDLNAVVESGARRLHPRDEDLAAHLDAATALLGLSVAEGWRPSVIAHLKATLAAACLVADFPLDDEIEPAPVWRL